MLSSHAHQGKVLQVTSASSQGAQSERENFFVELNRRNVYKVAVARPGICEQITRSDRA
jgi:hypothetical protein